MAFSDRQAALDTVVFDHLGDPARMLPADGSAPRDVRAIVETTSEAERFGDTGPVLRRTTLQLPVASAPGLRRGDRIEVGADAWRVAEAPARPGDGRVWVAALERDA